jgi:hypothetical protein
MLLKTVNANIIDILGAKKKEKKNSAKAVCTPSITIMCHQSSTQSYRPTVTDINMKSFSIKCTFVSGMSTNLTFFFVFDILKIWQQFFLYLFN